MQYARRVLRTSCGASVVAVLLSLSCTKREPTAENDVLAVTKTKTGPEMVLVPGGWFEMGSDREDEIDEPHHRVYVGSFYIDKNEVTQEEYEKVMGRNPSLRKGKQNPVEQVRWPKAAEYCNVRSRLEGLQPAYDEKTWRCDFQANGYRLPTEAEWEYAARAGTGTMYCYGDSPARLKDYGWFKENCTREPRPVGRKQANPWGLHDMHGNVWEWCNDFYQEDYYRQSPAMDPRGPETGENKVLRGGCWNSRPNECRSSYRNYENPGYTDVCFGKGTHGFVGFRCVKSAATPRNVE